MNQNEIVAIIDREIERYESLENEGIECDGQIRALYVLKERIEEAT